MFDKKHIESLLKINGVEKSASDEQIRSLLLSARFKDDEVDTALMVLRENVDTKKTRVEGLHRVFRSDQALQPAEISRLLGIEVAVGDTINIERSADKTFSFFHFLLLWLASLLVAVTAVLSYMYSREMGIFRPETSFAAYEKSTE